MTKLAVYNQLMKPERSFSAKKIEQWNLIHRHRIHCYSTATELSTKLAWSNSNITNPDLPSPEDYGWKLSQETEVVSCVDNTSSGLKGLYRTS